MGTIAEAEMNADTRKAFAEALKTMPFVIELLQGHERKMAPNVNTNVSHWKDIAPSTYLDDPSNVTLVEPRPKRFSHTKDIKNRKVYDRIRKADQFIRAMVQDDMLRTLNKPRMFVHKEVAAGYTTPLGFRAYQSSGEVHIAQNEDTSVLVHEIGHYVEANLPGNLWRDVAALHMHRHELEGGGTQAVRPVSIEGVLGEGGFKGEYPATGKYTAKAYDDGDTEVVSLTVEHLSHPSKAEKLLNKDPQQAAIVLRGLRPNEYATTDALRPFDKYLPQRK
jgi:hypothetical protein